MKRGDVYQATLEPRSGSEQRGPRPVIVVSNNGFNQVPSWRSIIVVPCTTSEAQRARGRTIVPLARGTAGLAQDSVAICHQVTTLDRSKFGICFGTLPPDDMDAVDQAIKHALALR